MATINKSSRFTKSDNPRDKFITFYLTQDELNEIKGQVANLSGISISKYCRSLLLGKKIVSNVDAKYIHEMSSLGANLNRLGGLQKELFNNSHLGKLYASDTANNLKDISIAIAEITQFVRAMKSSTRDNVK
ncbi:plasmid mobilization protein [Methylobacter psychrophilus]|uniref:plasmid mobilization protein n=1 Tax=Methylobacter psychrophilus TaxID=96941 RepID=UPI0021D50859|nr:hypothetical protein [Methylobacter psychrophilus]